MKKIVIVDGGPRKNMNTAQLLQRVAEGAKSVGEGVEVKTVRLYDIDYKGCTSCMACKLKGKASNICRFRDALSPLLDEIAEADGLVLGSPIYFGEVTGKMRAFLERLAFPWLSYNDYSLTAPKRMPVVLVETMNGTPERGNTAIVIEHNLDVIKVADHLIDIGPEGGEGGGEIVATGTPAEVAACEQSYTGAFLREIFNEKR